MDKNLLKYLETHFGKCIKIIGEYILGYQLTLNTFVTKFF